MKSKTFFAFAGLVMSILAGMEVALGAYGMATFTALMAINSFISAK